MCLNPTENLPNLRRILPRPPPHPRLFFPLKFPFLLLHKNFGTGEKRVMGENFFSKSTCLWPILSKISIGQKWVKKQLFEFVWFCVLGPNPPYVHPKVEVVKSKLFIEIRVFLSFLFLSCFSLICLNSFFNALKERQRIFYDLTSCSLYKFLFLSMEIIVTHLHETSKFKI
jgi:hypothetical protein